MKHVVEEIDVVRVPVPGDTRTYKSVSNASIINAVKEEVQNFGYQISEKQYRLNRGGSQMSGIYKLETDDPEMSMMVGFFNSYDKTRRFGIGSGALVNVCFNGLIMADFVTMRKHTGNIREEMYTIIYNAVKSIAPQWDKAKEEKKFFSGIPIDHIDVVHELIGEMYLSEKILTSNQLSALSKSLSDTENPFHLIDNKELVEGKTAWDMYNLVTESYKSETSIAFVDKHVKFHNYMKNKLTNEKLPEIIPTI